MEVFSDIHLKGGMYVKKYEVPSMEIIVFMDRDIITTSDLNGVDSGDTSDNKFNELFPGITNF